MNKVVSREEWLEHRKQHLAEEKKFSRMRDQLSEQRRQLPWVKVDKQYIFEGREGSVSLKELFGSHPQLIIYHFMFATDWEEGCPSCSFWADNFDGIENHLGARNTALAVVSLAPYEKLAKYKDRMGWSFNWVSSCNTGFNIDFHVTFNDDLREKGEAIYNYKPSTFPMDEAPGISVFSKGDDGSVYHTYSTYSRGLDMLNGTYHFLDLLPKGRDEADLQYPQAWVQRHDEYDQTR